MEAMSSAWPVRPSGVCAIILLLKIGTNNAGGMRAFSLNHAGIDGIYADLSRAKFTRKHAGNCVHRAFGAGINRGVGGRNAS